MDIQKSIHEAYGASKSYPELVKKLIDIGVQSYTVEVASSTILYRLKDGENILHTEVHTPREIAATFNEQQTVQAIRDNQAGKTDYPGFMDAIAKAGVRLYEATLNGGN
ncbi:MAG TPA: DUF1398 family protein, partial [Flavisolibacter sp.]|nr:DUF1398 family protein [Flavisolibacter sp.]